MIKLNKVNFGYKTKPNLFSGLECELAAGSVTGLLGRNGEGKSTLMKLISGQLIPQKGSEVSVLGHEPAKREVEHLQQVYLLPEEPQLPGLTVMQYLDTYGAFYPNYDADIAHELLRELEVDPSWHLKHVSLGQKKKVAIALSLAVRTPLLMMDEPTNGLDIPSKSVFRRLLAKYVTPEQTVIISTHQVRDLEQVIDRILLLDHNRVVCNRSVGDLSDLLTFASVGAYPDREPIYVEATPMGQFGVYKREPSDEEGIDFSMELFFNAMVSNPGEMHLHVLMPVKDTTLGHEGIADFDL